MLEVANKSILNMFVTLKSEPIIRLIFESIFIWSTYLTFLLVKKSECSSNWSIQKPVPRLFLETVEKSSSKRPMRCSVMPASIQEEIASIFSSCPLSETSECPRSNCRNVVSSSVTKKGAECKLAKLICMQFKHAAFNSMLVVCSATFQVVFKLSKVNLKNKQTK